MKDLDLLHYYIGIVISKKDRFPLDHEVSGIVLEAQSLMNMVTDQLDYQKRMEQLSAVKFPEPQYNSVVDYKKLNLLYHITPMGNWEWNLAQLAKRIHIFGGHRVFTIAIGKELTAPDRVAAAIEKFTSPSVILGIPNDAKLRETRAFTQGLEVISKLPREGYTFYAHTKGVTRGDHPAVKLWTTAMYHYNLDDPDKVMQLLKTYPIAGCFKRSGKYAGFPVKSTWHYSGTFFWFRNVDLFSKPGWEKAIPNSRYGTEAYLSMLFKDREAGVIQFPKVGDLYNLSYIKNLLGSDLNLIEAYGDV